MRTHCILALAALLAIATAAQVRADVPARAADAVRTELQQVDARLREARTQYAPTHPAVVRLEQRRTQLEREFDRLTHAALKTSVTVDFTRTPLRTAAKLLSDTTHVQIDVDPAVSSTLSLGIQVRDVPLASLLAAIGEQTHLMIAPQGDGVVLRPWPSIQVGGRHTEQVGRNAPWSDAWGSDLPGLTPSLGTELGQRTTGRMAFYTQYIPPSDIGPAALYTVVPLGQKAVVMASQLAAPQTPAVVLTVLYRDKQGWRRGESVTHRLRGDYSPDLILRTPDPATTWQDLGTVLEPPSVAQRLPAPFSVTTLGDSTIVVAEPAPNTEGIASRTRRSAMGLLLTTYVLQKGQLKRTDQSFQPAEPPEAAAEPTPRK